MTANKLTEICAHPPPWDLRGSAIAMLGRDARGRWQIELWVHYTHSPVGPYDEAARAQLRSHVDLPTLDGNPRICKYLQMDGTGSRWRFPLPTIVEMRVSLDDSRRCGRANWGFPKTLHRLKWRESQKRIAFQNETQTTHFRVASASFPLQLRAFVVQVLADNMVRVSMKIGGRACIVWRGKRWGVMLQNFEFHVAPPVAIPVQ